MMSWADERVLVTGSSGFIGTNLVRSLMDGGARTVAGIDRKLNASAHRSEFTFICADLRNARKVESAVQGFAPSVVYHMASRTDLDGTTLRDYSDTTVGTEMLLSALGNLERPVRLVVTSTRLVCPTGYIPQRDDDYKPNTVYGASKVEQELIVRRKSPPNVAWTIVRPTSIWGPHFGVPYRPFFEAVRRGLYVHPRGVRTWKSMGYVENTVSQLKSLAQVVDGPGRNRTLTLCDYKPLEVYDWASTIASIVGSRVREVPQAWLHAAARMGDVLRRAGMSNPPLTTFRLKNLLTEMVYPTDELAQLCGPIPFTLEQGVARTVKWLGDH